MCARKRGKATHNCNCSGGVQRSGAGKKKVFFTKEGQTVHFHDLLPTNQSTKKEGADQLDEHELNSSEKKSGKRQKEKRKKERWGERRNKTGGSGKISFENEQKGWNSIQIGGEGKG